MSIALGFTPASADPAVGPAQAVWTGITFSASPVTSTVRTMFTPASGESEQVVDRTLPPSPESPFGNGSEQPDALANPTTTSNQSLGDLRFCMTTPEASSGAACVPEKSNRFKLVRGILMKSFFEVPNREGLTVSRVTEQTTS